MTVLPEPSDWYRDQVVFLTGATGNLGGCLLYKLAVQLPTSKIYVLCRGSMRDAMTKWEASMPEQIEDILDTGKVQCLTGDITQPKLGLTSDELEILQKEVTVVMHSAAKLSFFQNLAESVRVNCVPVVELARLLSSFNRIKAFLHISTVSTQSFLPGGVVLENANKSSPDEEPAEKQLEDILSTGHSPHAENFLAPYSQSKYLAEQILLGMETTFKFPILIVRPTNIGPAIQHPYSCYGPEGAIPVHTFFQLLFEGGERRKLGDLDSLPQDLIVDEIPVDIAANACLFHLAIGSTGIVQAGAQLYVPTTFGQFIAQLRKYAPRKLVEKAAHVRVKRNVHFANHANDIIHHVSRGWEIDCTRTNDLKHTDGPIGLSLAGHDFESFVRRRITRQARSLESWIDNFDKD
ncbi:male sterility protein-domain-containing protein [Penicillium cosmopolitanum]|uniref:Fatty acyl-CoA reductase n=1 Tax=Penicillium cosmopolitanum TaxID=1131564 RepID=A0A9W9SKC4_9EURO|nr:male sterility protein-domain-containing protein [Penicillium cosmopolitanum]KAJ5379545.1 male sterility protein-domain-containing protein [Penicillium cosmopolitanum]